MRGRTGNRLLTARLSAKSLVQDYSHLRRKQLPVRDHKSDAVLNQLLALARCDLFQCDDHRCMQQLPELFRMLPYLLSRHGLAALHTGQRDWLPHQLAGQHLVSVL